MRKGHGRGTLKSFCRGIKRKLKWNFIKFQERKIIQINFTTEEEDKRERDGKGDQWIRSEVKLTTA